MQLAAKRKFVNKLALTLSLGAMAFGLFWLVINALMLEFASLLVPGFVVRGFGPAFWGALILSLLNFAIRAIL